MCHPTHRTWHPHRSQWGHSPEEWEPCPYICININKSWIKYYSGYDYRFNSFGRFEKYFVESTVHGNGWHGSTFPEQSLPLRSAFFLASKERLILLQVIMADVSRGELFAPKTDIDEPLSVSWQWGTSRKHPPHTSPKNRTYLPEHHCIPEMFLKTPCSQPTSFHCCEPTLVGKLKKCICKASLGFHLLKSWNHVNNHHQSDTGQLQYRNVSSYFTKQSIPLSMNPLLRIKGKGSLHKPFFSHPHVHDPEWLALLS